MQNKILLLHFDAKFEIVPVFAVGSRISANKRGAHKDDYSR